MVKALAQQYSTWEQWVNFNEQLRANPRYPRHARVNFLIRVMTLKVMAQQCITWAQWVNFNEQLWANPRYPRHARVNFQIIVMTLNAMTQQCITWAQWVNFKEQLRANPRNPRHARVNFLIRVMACRVAGDTFTLPVIMKTHNDICRRHYIKFCTTSCGTYKYCSVNSMNSGMFRDFMSPISWPKIVDDYWILFF